MLLKRLRRMPKSALAVLLFAVIVAAVLCQLHKTNQKEIADFQEVYNAIPVTVTVTNLTGNRSDMLEMEGWVPDLFQMNPTADYVKDVKIQMRHDINNACAFQGFQLKGISMEDMAENLMPSRGGEIRYFEGYDGSMFSSPELLCLIPEGTEGFMNEDGTVTLAFRCRNWHAPLDATEEELYVETELSFTVAGTFSSYQDSMYVYTSYLAVKKVYTRMGCEREVDSVSATLANNEQLEEFRELVKQWFAEPNPKGEKTPCTFLTYQYFPFALDIDDGMLRRATATLQTSIAINQFSTFLVFVLSAGAGFFLGFLMVRNRKREIMLMRTLGKPNSHIYRDFAAEQMVWALAGIAIGGSFFRWEPLPRLVLFGLVYFAGLSAALVLFLRSKLLTNIKEDE